MAATVAAEITSPPPPRRALLEARHLRVVRGGQEILRDVNLQIAPGEFVVIVGRSGTGKTTLMNALLQFIPSDGDINRPAELGVIFQQYAVFPWLTVARNIAFGLRQVPREHRRQRVNELLKLTGLTDHARKYPAQLSGGQQQRVALARTLAPDPAAILMDEPFGSLDSLTRDECATWLLKIWEAQRKTVLFSTHSLEEAVYLGGRVLVLNGGCVAAEFAVPFSRPRTEEIKFTTEFVELKRQIKLSMQ